MLFDRSVFFDSVRSDLFSGSLTQQQVNGMNTILDVWTFLAIFRPNYQLDNRWLAYMLATTFHETAQTMWPIEEYGKGSGQPYGKPDPETGQTYYGRGFVQLTWRDNYARADAELTLTGDDSCEWHAENALLPVVASKVMFIGMYKGWFRSGHDLPRYFNDAVDDPYNAREIINGDKSKNGNLVADYHNKFLAAIEAGLPDEVSIPEVTISTTGAVRIVVNETIIECE